MSGKLNPGLVFTVLLVLCFSCGSKKDIVPPAIDIKKNPSLNNMMLNGAIFNTSVVNVSAIPQFRLVFSQPIKAASLTAISLSDDRDTKIPVATLLSDNDSVVLVQPAQRLSYLTKYTFSVSTALQSASGGSLQSPINGSFVTTLDSSRKFPVIANNALLDTIQKRTFNYFWDFAHPVSGMIREGSKHPSNIVTTGGTGFGIMALLVGIERGFITRTEGLQRIEKITDFLENKVQTFHGAFPHWLDGTSGNVIPFSQNDNGADLVETAFLVQGLISARQYFSGGGEEVLLRTAINAIADSVEWNWFRQNNQQVLYWHWSADKGWAMNLKIRGWNESLVTYVLAAGSKEHAITRQVYDEGWAGSGTMKNGQSFYNIRLPLGPDYGGPLFFEHYSFMGINPNGLSDAYASYEEQAKNHSLINYHYCSTNPKNYFGYSDSVWGLTASNIKNGYAAASPTNDQGFIAPTAAIASLPYTPAESMAALQFYYYVLGDKLWKEYGFVDAFSLDVLKNNGAWFDDAFLAIDQGPIIVMIENYRTKLLWNLFMSAPEVQNGLTKLGFAGF
ncbi:glucoamylase family protein [Niabella drilacis]|nr:glucoamylase family protein [Niabella drilacis]